MLFCRQTTWATHQRARREHGQPHGHGEVGPPSQKPADRRRIQVRNGVKYNYDLIQSIAVTRLAVRNSVREVPLKNIRLRLSLFKEKKQNP